MTETIPAKLKPYYDQLLKLFFDKVKIQDYEKDGINHEGNDLYYKWTTTARIAMPLNKTSSTTINNLTKLEKLGLITSERKPHYVLWAATNIPGFKQHQLGDYYYRN